MTLSEYLIEAVAQRKSGKYLDPSKDSIIKWLDSKGFRRYEWDGVGERHIVDDERAYMVGPGRRAGRVSRYNWISIHTPDIYELVVWFDENDMFKEHRL